MHAFDELTYCNIWVTFTLLFSITQKAPSVRKGTKAFQPGQFSQAALQVMPDKDQEKLLREGNPFLLTEAALRKLDISMGVLQLRQFACEACDRVWWKTVPCTKPVSKCFQCKTKYDALPREKEFGIGRYRCLECNNSFFSRCEATSERPCFNCDFTVRAPYIHPKFKPIRRRRPPVDPSTSPFEPPKYEKIIYYVRDPSRRSALPVLFYVPLQRKPRKKVVNASTIHDSTGSTASTFVTQIEFPTSILSEAGTTDIVPVVISDPESDDEDVMLCSSSSDSESEEESSVPPQSEAESVTDMESTAGAMAGSDSSSDSDDPYPKAPRKRSAASSSSNSDSDSEQDADKKPSQTPLKRQSSTDSHMSADKESTLSSTKDSGLGTAGSGSLATGSSAPTRSTSGSDHGIRCPCGIIICRFRYV